MVIVRNIKSGRLCNFQDTAEVQEAKARFGDAFADAEAGIVSNDIMSMIMYFFFFFFLGGG